MSFVRLVSEQCKGSDFMRNTKFFMRLFFQRAGIVVYLYRDNQKLYGYDYSISNRIRSKCPLWEIRRKDIREVPPCMSSAFYHYIHAMGASQCPHAANSKPTTIEASISRKHTSHVIDLKNLDKASIAMLNKAKPFIRAYTA